MGIRVRQATVCDIEALAPLLDGYRQFLNDLFVNPSARGPGAGGALLEAAAQSARRVGAFRPVLSTELTNTAAQSLYEKLGWERNTDSCNYQLSLQA